MADKLTILALFSDVEPVVKAIDKLHEMGIDDKQIDIISGIPLSHEVLGRRKLSTFVPRLALAGAIIGFVFAVFFMFGVPFLFALHVGGQPLYAIPPFYIVAFEMTMLGLMGTAFISLFLAGRFPTFEPKIYVSQISDGKIAVTFPCQESEQSMFEEAMKSLDAEQVNPVEEKTL